MFYKWLRACAMALGHNPDDIDLEDAYDMVLAASLAPMPTIAPITSFYPWLRVDTEEKAKPLETGVRINHKGGNVEDIRSAEQFIALANAGLANLG